MNRPQQPLSACVPTVVADVPLGRPPVWAVLQRRLFDALDEAWRVYRARYCLDDGSLRYEGPVPSRDGADDFYEAFVNWPVLYQLGGADDLLDVCKHHWEGVTAQLSDLGYLVDEFERGYDWFHIGESMTLFYDLCSADPSDKAFQERAYRFASFYLPGSAAANYDAASRTIRAPHNGAGGPRWGINDEWMSFGAHLASMRPFGLPLDDVAGITDWRDLEDPHKAAAMGAEMAQRLGRGDTAVNLAVTSLVTNAWLYAGDDAFRQWVLEYAHAWDHWAQDNGGLVPDNIGPTGQVGELHGGRWYGGPYGWKWPHGVYSVGNAVCISAVNRMLLTGNAESLDTARAMLDILYSKAVTGSVAATEMSIRDRWEAELGEEVDHETLLVPNRHADSGWFDFQPPQLALPTWLWMASFEQADWDRISWLRDSSGYDWRTVRDFHNKEEGGHEAPWLAYLSGDNPGYPEDALRMALGQVQRRLELIARDDTHPAEMHIHHWQRHNPVVTEVLLQLSTGTPQTLYNGGLTPTHVAYFDSETRRPGLPNDVAALVDTMSSDRTSLELVNLSGTQARRLVLQLGGFGQDRIDSAVATTGHGEFPGDPTRYVTSTGPRTTSTTRVEGNRLEVVLPPARSVHLELHRTPHAYQASYQPRTTEET